MFLVLMLYERLCVVIVVVYFLIRRLEKQSLCDDPSFVYGEYSLRMIPFNSYVISKFMFLIIDQSQIR